MTIKLSQLPEGSVGTITNLELPDNLAERLFGMGFVIGEKIETIRRAPLGDPTVYKIMDTNVTLRNELSSNIFVDAPVVPLSSCRSGKYEIVKICAGRGLIHRLTRENLIKGTSINIVENLCGSLKVEVNGKICMVPRGQARKIIVREAN